MSLPIKVIDRYCTFNYLLSYVDISFPEHETKCFCPFHENFDTPAAKLFVKPEGENLYCFSEGRAYYPHHLLTLGIVPFTVDHVFSMIWSNLSEEERDQFGEDTPTSLVKDFSPLFSDYRRGAVGFDEVISILLRELDV